MKNISLNEIRKDFLNYFESNSHKVLPSDSLIPLNKDKSVLFTNSGMMQFKNFFTAIETPNYTKIATSQKCLRAGGKHNDLENVGYTNRHHTFFEMLGNFSFGNYFKEEAILYAWEFLTKNLNLNKNKLYFTVYESDEESLKLWKKITGFNEDRITKIKTDDNFWSMGDTGPCGPCSEIFYDLGDKAKIEGANISGGVGENDRYIEIWNLVFMQFEKDINLSRENYKKLPKPCVDTGMGLERIAAVLNEKSDNYDNPFFSALIENIKQLYNISSKKQIEDKKTFYSLRIIADHIRAISFLIADGILPDKTGRGYVLRRIMRRAMRYSHYLNENENLFYKIFDSLVGQNNETNMSNYFSELEKNKNLIISTIEEEEKSFKHLLKKGNLILEEESKNGKCNITGETAFKLYDTFGFPLDLTKDFARENNLKIDEETFDKLMKNQQEMAKKNWKGSYAKDELEKLAKIEEELKAKGIEHSKPFYYPEHGARTSLDNPEIVALIDEDYNLILDKKEIEAKIQTILPQNYKIIFKETVFYPEGGGQESDIGCFSNGKRLFEINNVKKIGNLILHNIALLEEDVPSTAFIWSLRQEAPKNHTATHLLQSALRQVLGSHVMQKGSNVNEEGLRFDFSHNKALTQEELIKITDLINYWIKEGLEVKNYEISKEEANKKGALCFFEDKYGDKVRILEVLNKKNEAISIEFCGGTHVKNTKEIENFLIVSETSVSSGIRRIEAVAGYKASTHYWFNQNKENEEKKIKLEEKVKELELNLKKKDEELLKYKVFYFSKENLEQDFNKEFENKILKEILHLEKLAIEEIFIEFKKTLQNEEKLSLLFLQNGDFNQNTVRQFCLNFKGQKKSNLIAIINNNKESLYVNILKSNDCNFNCKKVMEFVFNNKGKFGGIESNLQGQINLN